jgi:hypothetical protein
MSILQLMLGIFMVFSLRLLYPWITNKLSLITFFSLTALFLNAVFSQLRIMNLAYMVLETTTLSLVIAGLLFSRDLWPGNTDNTPPKQEHLKRLILIFTGGLMALICIHNIGNMGYLLSETNRETIGTLSPWGIFFNAAILLFALYYSINNQTYNIVNSSLFRVSILTSALAFSVVLFLVALKLLPGNTDKIALGIGGVGFGNMSTNETSLLGCCLLLWVLQIQYVRGVSLMTLACLPSLIVMVLLTQSRIGIFCVFIIVFLYIFYTGKFRIKEILITFCVIALLSIPAFNVFVDRMEADSSMDGSGRAFIWVNYIDAFSEVATQKPLAWIFGVGPAGVVKLYNNTILEFFGLEVAQGTYFPLHSDVVFIFLTSGFLGLILWFGLVTTAYTQIKRSGRHFCSVASFIIFVLYSFFDMMIYSTLSVWLLALAITYPGNNQPNISHEI